MREKWKEGCRYSVSGCGEQPRDSVTKRVARVKAFGGLRWGDYRDDKHSDDWPLPLVFSSNPSPLQIQNKDCE